MMVNLDTPLTRTIPVIDWCIPPSMLMLQDGRPHPDIQRCRFAVTFGLLIGPLLLLLSILRMITGDADQTADLTDIS